MFVGINRNLQTLKNTAFMDFTAYYKRVGIITGFTSGWMCKNRSRIKMVNLYTILVFTICLKSD